MEEITTIEQIIKYVNVEAIVAGLLLISAGIAIGVFKVVKIWLVAGSYLDEKSEDFMAIFIGLFLGLLGGIVILSTFNLSIMNYFHSTMAGAFLLFFPLLFAFLCTAVITWIKIKKEKDKESY